MVYDVQWRLSSDQVLLELFHTCLIDEETRNFLNCHKFYLYPNYHIINSTIFLKYLVPHEYLILKIKKSIEDHKN